MPLTLTENSKELVSSLIDKEFHSIDFQIDYIDNKSSRLISLCMDLALWEKANELNELKELEIS